MSSSRTKHQGFDSSFLSDFEIKINGSPVPPKVKNDLIAVTVYEEIAVPSMFTLELYNWDMDQLKVTWSDDELFSEGNEVEIKMGYLKRLEKLMVGEITGLEAAFLAAEPFTLTVRGYDHRHRLMRGRKTRSFSKMKDSAIASQIASGAGLSTQVEDSKVTLDYVLQHNQTDLEFLQARARRIGYEVFVKEKKLYFQPHQHSASKSLTLGLETDMIEFYPRLTTMSQVGELVVRGWDLKEKKPIVGKAQAGDESSPMGSTSGPQAANKGFGESSTASVNRPVLSQAEADQMALGQFSDMALTYISGDGVCLGNTELRAGIVVEIEGLGQRFSGQYYVTSTTHTLRPGKGYRTAFTVRRNAT